MCGEWFGDCCLSGENKSLGMKDRRVLLMQRDFGKLMVKNYTKTVTRGMKG